MPTLIATPFDMNANSYCTVAEADAYHETHIYADTWNNADDDTKTAALIWATRLLEDMVRWEGVPTRYTHQNLRWPRWGVLDRDRIKYFDSEVIPQWLKNATAEFARQLMAVDRTKDRSYGILEVQADVVSVKFDKADAKPVFPQAVLAMIQYYGIVQETTGNTARLVRA